MTQTTIPSTHDPWCGLASSGQLFLRFFGFGTGSSRMVILTSLLSHSASSI